jgi:hypothetical protein
MRPRFYRRRLRIKHLAILREEHESRLNQVVSEMAMLRQLSKVNFFIVFAPSAIQVLRGFGGFLANALAVIVGVGILKSLSAVLVKLFTHSRASMVLTEWIGSIVFAALLGVLVQRRWRTRTARWIWMPALLWFLFGLTGPAGPLGNPWLTFSGIACVHERGISCIQFTIFTTLLVRASTYSLAAFLTSRSSAQHAAEFHPVLSHLFSGLFLVGLPKIGDQSPKEQPVINSDKPE